MAHRTFLDGPLTEGERFAFLADEYDTITRRLEALYDAQGAGDDTVLTAQRIQRLKSLQYALLGRPEAMARREALPDPVRLPRYREALAAL
ncbi:hypothetical protein [Streptomyces sp. NPDC026589]|uniref:hypothetical protein n=1 Tax=Streptomyces sp. NPDC026589 TaxID=3155609 RepID=UPI0033DD3092